MLTTVKEYHIGIDLGLQDINSERKANIKPEDKDWILNEVALQYINSRVNPKSNPKGEGFEETQKRLDDLSPLKRTGVLRLYKDGIINNCMYGYLPKDYYMMINSRSRIQYDCNGVTTTSLTYTRNICVVPFAKDTSTVPYYSNFRLTYNGNALFSITNYNISNALNKEESRFMYILLVLEEINKRTDLEVYWENYGSAYYQNSFIFVRTDTSGSIPLTIGLLYDGYTGSFNFQATYYVMYDAPTSMTEVSNRPVPANDTFLANENYYMSTRHNSPIVFLEGRFIKVLYNTTFMPYYINISYYKLPRKISLALNQTFEIPERAEELVNMAVQKIKARINDDNYKQIIGENSIYE